MEVGATAGLSQMGTSSQLSDLTPWKSLLPESGGKTRAEGNKRKSKMKYHFTCNRLGKIKQT